MILVSVRLSNDFRPPLSVYHPFFLHVEPAALYLQYVGDQQLDKTDILKSIVYYLNVLLKK